MKDKEIRGRLEAIRDNLALMNLEPSPLGKSTLAQVNELLKLLEANPPLAEVEGWIAEEDIKPFDGLFQIWAADALLHTAGHIPATITIRGKQ